MEQNTNALVATNNEGKAISSDSSVFTSEVKKFTTLDLSDKDNQIALYNSLQECDVRINDIIGQTIEIADLYIEEKPKVDEKTGELSRKFRVIVYDVEGKTYVSTAYGVYNSLRTIMSIFGNPSKENPIKVVVGKRPYKNTGKESLILTIAK